MAKFNPLVIGARQLEWHMTEIFRSKFGRSANFYWCEGNYQAPVNVLSGRRESFILEKVNPSEVLPSEYAGEVSVRADGTLKIKLTRTEKTDGMTRTEIIYLY